VQMPGGANTAHNNFLAHGAKLLLIGQKIVRQCLYSPCGIF